MCGRECLAAGVSVRVFVVPVPVSTAAAAASLLFTSVGRSTSSRRRTDETFHTQAMPFQASSFSVLRLDVVALSLSAAPSTRWPAERSLLSALRSKGRMEGRSIPHLLQPRAAQEIRGKSAVFLAASVRCGGHERRRGERDERREARAEE